MAKDFRDYLDGLGAKADWQPYVNGWQEYLKNASVDAETEKAIRQEVGRVLYDKLGSKDDGISSLRDALRMNPGDYTLRRELAERLERAGHYDVAVEQFHLLIAAAPQTASFWRSLSHSYAGLGKTEPARTALAPLIASGEATSDERRRYALVAPRGAALRSQSIGHRELHAFQFEAQVEGAAVEVVSALQPALSKLYPHAVGKLRGHLARQGDPHDLGCRWACTRSWCSTGAGEFDILPASFEARRRDDRDGRSATRVHQ